MGGGKGGSDFNPKGKSDAEVMRFCQAMMTELSRHIGPDCDVPAGDIGVGGREIGYLYGQYKKLRNEHTGVLTGKGRPYGGSLIRPEATGYGLCYFVENTLNHVGDSFKGKNVLVSGSGNVAQYATEKADAIGWKGGYTFDSGGFIHDPNGIDAEKLAYVMDLKNVRRGRIHEYAETFGCEYYPNQKPWGIQADVALPCATQNELNGEDALTLVNNGVLAVGEGANMPTTAKELRRSKRQGIVLPWKSLQCRWCCMLWFRDVAKFTSLSWTREEVDARLQGIMKDIHQQCVQFGEGDDGVDYVRGANLAGFVKVADALLAYGVV